MGWLTKLKRGRSAAPAIPEPRRQLWLEVDHEDETESPRRCVASTQAGEPCRNTPAVGYVACTPHGGRTLPPLRRVK